MGAKTGAVVGEAEVNGLFDVWAGQALSGGSGRSVASVAPRRLFAPHKPSVPGRLEAPEMLFAPCRPDVVPGRLVVVHMLVFLGIFFALGTFVVPQTLFAPQMPFAPHRLVSL